MHEIDREGKLEVEVETNHIGKSIEIVLPDKTTTEGIKLMVLVETAPVKVLELVYVQLLIKEAVYIIDATPTPI